MKLLQNILALACVKVEYLDVVRCRFVLSHSTQLRPVPYCTLWWLLDLDFYCPTVQPAVPISFIRVCVIPDVKNMHVEVKMKVVLRLMEPLEAEIIQVSDSDSHFVIIISRMLNMLYSE